MSRGDGIAAYARDRGLYQAIVLVDQVMLKADRDRIDARCPEDEIRFKGAYETADQIKQLLIELKEGWPKVPEVG